MELKGVPLSVYTEEPDHIPDGKKPVETIPRFRKRVMEAFDSDRYDLPKDLYRDCTQLPTEVLDRFSIVEIMKIRSASCIMLRSREVNERFDEVPEYRIFDKIASSLWRWGYVDFREEWNTLVDAYRGIRSFAIDLPDFAVTLTYTTGHNECGLTVHDRELFLDGVFGFLVHYKGEHVMTIGFTFTKGRRIVLTQVQMKKEKGNRFLYKLPKPYVEFALDLLARHFPTLELCILEGAASAKKYLAQYKNLLERTLEWQEKNEERIAAYEREFGSKKKKPSKFEREQQAYRLNKYRKDYIEEVAFVRQRIVEIEGETGARIRATYDRDHGPWHRDTARMEETNGVRFCPVVRVD